MIKDMEHNSILTDRQTRIPKVIHYCWFGGNAKSDLLLKCINSWYNYCPDYEIIEWNEHNWDVRQYPYTSEAFDAKKWAFVSDVARLDILFRYGGIYLDTDVELKEQNPFDSFLDREAFFAFENERAINTGMCCGTCEGTSLFQELLDSYRNRHFNPNDIKKEINTALNKPVFKRKLPIEWNDKHQIVKDVEILSTGQFNNFAHHYGARTWDAEQAQYTMLQKPYKNTALKRWLRSPKKFRFVEDTFGDGRILSAYTFLAYDLLECGPMYFVVRFAKKAAKLLTGKR